MALNLDKLARINDFILMTKALGEIRCATLNLRNLSTVEEMAKSPNVDGRIFSRKVIGMVSTKRTDVQGLNGTEIKEMALTDNEIQLISNEEVETFASEFVAHNRWLLHSGENKKRQTTMREKSGSTDTLSPKTIGPEKGNDETSSDYLVRVLIHYLDEQSQQLKRMTEPPEWLAANPFEEQMKKILGPIADRVTTSIFNDSTMMSLRENFSLSDQLQETIRAFDKSTFDRSLVNARLKQPPISMRDIKVPENPILETNRQLNGVLEHIENIRPIAVQSAELIRNMNDTALQMQADFMRNARSTQKYAGIAIMIAVASLLISSFFSWLGYEDAKQAAVQNDIQLKSFQQEIRNLIAAQEKDRIALLSTLNNQLRNNQIQYQQSNLKK
jgi:hypothetical protein